MLPGREERGDDIGGDECCRRPDDGISVPVSVVTANAHDRSPYSISHRANGTGSVPADAFNLLFHHCWNVGQAT